MLNIIEQISKGVQAVEDGNQGALELYAQLTSISKECELAKQQILESVQTEAEMYSEKTFKQGRFEFTKVPSRGRYDYSNDVQWTKIKKQLDERQQLMKDACKTTGIIIDENSEVVDAAIYKPTKSSISIKKIEG